MVLAEGLGTFKIHRGTWIFAPTNHQSPFRQIRVPVGAIKHRRHLLHHRSLSIVVPSAYTALIMV